MSSLIPLPVRIVDQYDDGLDARHITFEAFEPERMRPAKPGQFLMLSLPGVGEAPFTYVHGPDHFGRFDLLVRRVGALTGALFELAPSAVLGVRGPFGRGWPDDSLGTERVLAVAGGCGLAPLAAALDELASAPAPRGALIYGSRSEPSQVLARERSRWRKSLPMFETFEVPSHAHPHAGTPLSQLEAALAALGGSADRALVCGPEAMMLAVAGRLHEHGISQQQIWLSLERRMHCGVGLCGHCYLAETYVCRQGPTYRYDQLLTLLAKSPARSAQALQLHHC